MIMNYRSFQLIEDSIQRIESPLKEKYILHQLQITLPLWIDGYNSIKDNSWPLCASYADFFSLPNWVQNECINIHNFSPDIWQNEINKDANEKYKGTYPWVSQHILELLERNQHTLIDKKIIDIGCHYGQYSIYAMSAGASHVVGADIRQSSIDVAEIMLANLHVSSKRVCFKIADLHDHKNIQQLCADRDTVLLLGVMYHVHDHFDILQNVSQKNVSNIVIEIAEDRSIMNSDSALIAWKKEATFEPYAGYLANHSEVFVGYPNVSWFDSAMKMLGFERTDTATMNTYVSSQKLDQFIQNRSVFLYQRIQQRTKNNA